MNVKGLLRFLKKDKKVVLKRVAIEGRVQIDRFRAPLREKSFSISSMFDDAPIDEIWFQLAQRRYLTATCLPKSGVESATFSPVLKSKSDQAQRSEVDLLGSGLLELGEEIDWHKDYKTGHRFPTTFAKSIDYARLDLPCDVKFPWDLSRLHWLLPVAQEFLWTRDEKLAECARRTLESWLVANPMAFGVNWACAMEVALRILSWTYLFHAFKTSTAWRDQIFRARFLASLYLHGEFVSRHLEYSDINGNHYTANAAGLVFCGLFFGPPADDFFRNGMSILETEVERQTYPDGPNFEGSIPYHRLATELFLLPCLYAQAQGRSVSDRLRISIRKMAEFTEAYSRGNISVPLLGDADDGRALPLGSQSVNDHSYLIGLAKALDNLIADETWYYQSTESESYWYGLPVESAPPEKKRAKAFKEAGYYVMRNEGAHVFVDCAPVGLAGRGGHGHNDCLSFEAVLGGSHLITDCGAYVYTASARDRDLFRSTDYHNTPRIDELELNPFDGIWALNYCAVPRVETWEPDGPMGSHLACSHSAYQRLKDPVKVKRDFILHPEGETLLIIDRLENRNEEHFYEIPYHFAAGLRCEAQEDNEFSLLTSDGRKEGSLWCVCGPHAWRAEREKARLSPSYGVVRGIERLVFRLRSVGSVWLSVVLSSKEGPTPHDRAWVRKWTDLLLAPNSTGG